jgi:hypothetical protein
LEPRPHARPTRTGTRAAIASARAELIPLIVSIGIGIRHL